MKNNFNNNSESVYPFFGYTESCSIAQLSLTNFRNYEFLRLNTNPNPVVLTGPNGAGKTNILEAISYLSPGRGIRNSKLSDIKRQIPNIANDILDDYSPFGFATATSWAVSSKIKKAEDILSIATGVEGVFKDINGFNSRNYEKRISKLENEKLSNQSELSKYITTVWLTPDMDRLFRGPVQPRRNFLDRLVFAFDSEHAKIVSNYEHSLKEWSTIIKSGNIDNNWLLSLEENIASFGVAIAASRRNLVSKLNNFIEKENEDVFPNVILKLNGIIENMLDKMPAIEVEDKFKSLLFEQRKNVTHNESVDGTHKTDLKVFHQSKKMPAELCSTGEQKALLISVILAHAKSLAITKGFSPILLLDEIVAHLDDKKREALLNKILELNIQAWMTGTDIESFNSLIGKAQFFHVENAKIKKLDM
jgi:DNA replication and repair protein RecF